MDMDYRTVKTKGLALNVAIAGQGEPVLLLHGFPDTHEVWHAQIAALAGAGYKVIAPDLRGYGGSEAPAGEGAYALALLGADMLGLLDSLGIGTVKLVGHDWGALLGWQLCHDAPERIERFVALSVGHPAAYAAAGLPQLLRAWYAALFRMRGVAEALVSAGGFLALRGQAANHEQFAHWRRHLSRPGRLTAALNYYRANADLVEAGTWAPITVPVLGVWSSKDVALVEKQMRGSAAYMAAPFRYQRLEGVGHWMQVEAAGAVNTLLLDFMKESPIAPRGT